MTQRFNPVIQSTILKTARNRTVLKKSSLSKVVRSRRTVNSCGWEGGGVIIFNESGGGSELNCLCRQDGLY